MSNRLENKVIVINGGTKGIGSGIATACAREGARVIVSGRDTNAGNQLIAEIRASDGEATFVRTDVTKLEECRRLIESAVDTYGRIDGLVNNAAIFPRAAITEVDENHFDRVFDVNVKGPLFCSRFAVERMQQSGSGSIVNIGSAHAWAGSIKLAVYACSKGALHTLTMHVAKNYAKDNIRSNWVTVGWVATPGELDRIEKDGHDAAWLDREGEQYVPLGRLQTNDDIAFGVIYLLSEESAQVTGTQIHATGGFLPS